MKSEGDYLNMQKNFYEAPIPPEAIVGNYAWHEEYPYETFLLFKNGDIRKPIFDTFNNKVALDFGCGPGRMVKKMRRLFYLLHDFHATHCKPHNQKKDFVEHV